jgi:hypothetical protein
MIGVDFTGRLGNQMFTYAFTRVLMEKYGEKSFTANFKRCGNPLENMWGDSLCHFNVMPYKSVNYDLILKKGTSLQRIAYIIYMLLNKLPLIGNNDNLMSCIEFRLRKKNIYFTGAADVAFQVERSRGPVFIRGYFQDKRFFDHIRPILTREFTPKHSPLEHNKLLYEAISQPNSVCVSVRRGDYLSATYKKDFYVCTPNYYDKAIQRICHRVEKPLFIFFSDDIQWVREHMHVEGYQCFYERGDDPVWETMRMMSGCHHFIISNSTFAWWASYLSDREGKIIIAPSRWFANPNWHSNLPGKDGFTYINNT